MGKLSSSSPSQVESSIVMPSPPPHLHLHLRLHIRDVDLSVALLGSQPAFIVLLSVFWTLASKEPAAATAEALRENSRERDSRLNYTQVYSHRERYGVRGYESSRGSSRFPTKGNCSAEWPPDALLTVDSRFSASVEVFQLKLPFSA